MPIFEQARQLIENVRALFTPTTVSELPGLLTPPASSGVTVNEHTALTYSAVWAAVNVISSDIASLPLHLYKRNADGSRERYVAHPLHWLLHDEPNPEQSSMEWREQMVAHALLWGNGYSEIQRDGAGRPIALWPITPNRVTVQRNVSGQLEYLVTNAKGGNAIVEARNMFHLRGLGFDGLQGYSVVSMARESIGLGLAAERFGSALFGNGSNVGSVLTATEKLTAQQKQEISEAITTYHRGPDKAAKLLVLSAGFKLDRMSIPPDDAQFLETRQHQVTEIARWFRIPPHKIGDLSRATFSNIEQQQIDYVTGTLRPWLVKFESELNRKLIAPLEKGIQYTEHLVDGLLRGDTASRYSAYATGRQNGWLSVNDIRGFENLNPVEGGDVYVTQVNTIPLDRLGEYADKLVATPAPPPSPVVEEEEEQERALIFAAHEARAIAEARLTEAADVRASLEAEIVKVRNADVQRSAAFLSAQRSLVTDVMGRMVERETERIRRAGTMPAKLKAILDDGFYEGHSALMERALTDVVKVHLAWIASDADSAEVTRDLVSTHVAESRSQLQAVMDGDAADLAPSLSTLMERWERERPSTLADKLMKESIEVVAS